MMIKNYLNTPWKIHNQITRIINYPFVRLVFFFSGVKWGDKWRIFGIPIILRHRDSSLTIGKSLQLRSTSTSNPLGVNHKVIFTTWEKGASISIGNNFSMTGGSICAAKKIEIGNNVNIGANSIIMDTDFHPLNPDVRLVEPQNAETAPVLIGDDVFIGMNCLILKGVTIGKGAVVGAGSVVTKNIPPYCIVAGNPARVIKEINS